MGDELAYPAPDATHYGLGIAALGEDRDEGVMAHGPRPAGARRGQRLRARPGRRALEAARTPGAHLAVTELWVVFHVEFGCTPEDHDAQHRDENGDIDSDRCDCKHIGLPPCEPQQFLWTYERVEPSTPGALPVTEVPW